MKKIKIAIADDLRLYREALVRIIQDHPQLELSFEAENGKDLMNQLFQAETQADILLLDLKMPHMHGIETPQKIKTIFKDLKIIALPTSMFNQGDLILHLLNIGVNGYLIKHASRQEVYEAIFAVMEEGYYFHRCSSSRMLQRFKKEFH